MRNVHNTYRNSKQAYLSDKKSYLEIYLKEITKDQGQDEAIYTKSEVD